jgi:dihydroxy-acid dehydratase
VLQDGDIIRIDIPNRTFDVDLPGDVLTARLKTFKPIRRNIPKGFMRRYVKTVSSAARGAVLA